MSEHTPKLRFIAMVVGSMLDLFLTEVFVGIVMSFVDLEQRSNSQIFMVFLPFGILASLCGGATAALIARSRPQEHGIGSGLLTIIFSIFFTLMIAQSQISWSIEFASVVLTVASAWYGGYLAARYKPERFR